jgi:hypothetical protein
MAHLSAEIFSVLKGAQLARPSAITREKSDRRRIAFLRAKMPILGKIRAIDVGLQMLYDVCCW